MSQFLTSMYSWYEEAAETLVYLADVLSSSELGDLTKSRWMTRAWTLQGLHTSKTIRFYDCGWKLYLKDMHANHKESPAIRQELAHALGATPETITNFRPEDLGVRQKLRLALTREATVEEDIAYSLIGIFSSNIAPRYGFGKTVLGQLSENIAWTGKSLPYNSALPDSLAVYDQILYTPPPIFDRSCSRIHREESTEPLTPCPRLFRPQKSNHGQSSGCRDQLPGHHSSCLRCQSDDRRDVIVYDRMCPWTDTAPAAFHSETSGAVWWHWQL